MEKLRILVIDKSETFRLLMSNLLSSHQAEFANCGQKGLKIFKHKSFDLVIIASDLSMSWQRVIGEMRGINSEIKVILTTVKADKEFCDQVLTNGIRIDAFLDKGSVVETLDAKIEKVFSGKS